MRSPRRWWHGAVVAIAAALLAAGPTVPGAIGSDASAPSTIGWRGGCGALQEMQIDGSTVCTHGSDPAPAGVDVGRPWEPPRPAQSSVPPPQPLTAAAAPAPVPCYGDGTSGNRVQALYAYPADRPDRYDQVVASIRQWAADADAVFAKSAATTGGTRHVRFVTDAACTLVVERVPLTTAGDDTFENTIAELGAAGYTRPDRKYLVWVDSTVLCGIAAYYPDDRAGQDNANNGDPSIRGTVARVDSGCWGFGGRGESVEAHELMHMLGAVEPSAPHATLFGHCTDDADRMCYADGSPQAIQDVCPAADEALFDCDHDDYFNTEPPSGSYLATHWNAARSSFLAAEEPSPGGTGPAPGTKPTTRIAGEDRAATAVAISRATFPTDRSASAAVLASIRSFADALAGTPLAIAKEGPLLLTSGDRLDGRVALELRRVLAGGHTVYVLGGEAALGPTVAGQVTELGYRVERLGGATRFATAVAIADRGLDNPTVVFEATGLAFPDALSGGTAAALLHGAVLLTDGSRQAPDTAAYLAMHPATRRHALGGPAAAADPAAAPIVGADRYDTAVRVAGELFGGPPTIGVASGVSFPDALAGGAHIAAAGGPMLLVPPTGALPAPVQTYTRAHKDTLRDAFVYGGVAAIGEDIRAALAAAIT
jgi:hypothetical protein